MARLRCARCGATRDFEESRIDGRDRDEFELQGEAHERFRLALSLKASSSLLPCLSADRSRFPPSRNPLHPARPAFAGRDEGRETGEDFPVSLSSLTDHLQATHDPAAVLAYEAALKAQEVMERRGRSEGAFEALSEVLSLPREPLCLYHEMGTVTSCCCRRRKLLKAARSRYREVWGG